VVPSYHDPKYKDSKVETGRDGYFFSIIRNGVRTMPAYGHALTERDAWSVVAYVRALQAAAEGTLGDVPADKRDQVQLSQPAAGQPQPTGVQK
jgi:mono/diheme cytochrome c family protein